MKKKEEREEVLQEMTRVVWGLARSNTRVHLDVFLGLVSSPQHRI